MPSSSVCLFFLSMAILSAFLLVSASALTSTKYIDAICGGNPFCMQTLTTYPPAVSATDLVLISKPQSIQLLLFFLKLKAKGFFVVVVVVVVVINNKHYVKFECGLTQFGRPKGKKPIYFSKILEKLICIVF